MTELLDVELSASTRSLGLTPPPVPLDARIVREGDAWRVIVRGPAGRALETAEWLKRTGASSVEPPTRAEGTVVSAAFTILPYPLARAATRLRLRGLRVEPDGRARVTALATRDALRELLAGVDGSTIVRCVLARTQPRRLLTPRQEEVLARAVAEGYYRVPRSITLVQLATKCGVSTSSLSEILRRAEARVIHNYAEWGNAHVPVDAPGMDGAGAPGVRLRDRAP